MVSTRFQKWNMAGESSHFRDGKGCSLGEFGKSRMSGGGKQGVDLLRE